MQKHHAYPYKTNRFRLLSWTSSVSRTWGLTKSAAVSYWSPKLCRLNSFRQDISAVSVYLSTRWRWTGVTDTAPASSKRSLYRRDVTVNVSYRIVSRSSTGFSQERCREGQKGNERDDEWEGIYRWFVLTKGCVDRRRRRSVRLGEEMSDENVGGTDGWDASGWKEGVKWEKIWETGKNRWSDWREKERDERQNDAMTGRRNKRRKDGKIGYEHKNDGVILKSCLMILPVSAAYCC